MRISIVSLAALAMACTPEPPQGARSALLGASDEIVLDERGGARIVGRLEPAPPNADPDRVLVIRTERDGQPIVPALEGARALDARFAGEHVVVLGADHVLRLHGAGDRSADVVELDRDAEPPLSIAGDQIAYVRGEMPFFEVALADASTGIARQLTQGMAPAWSPALSADGREIVFVSSVDGRPRLHRTDLAGGVTRLAPSARTPSSPESPRLEGGHLFFRDEGGAAVVELASGRVIEVPQ